MTTWLLGACGIAALAYGLHRIALWLEAHGWLYYFNKRSQSSGCRAFSAIQELVEPRSAHVWNVSSEARFAVRGESGAGGDAATHAAGHSSEIHANRTEPTLDDHALPTE